MYVPYILVPTPMYETKINKKRVALATKYLRKNRVKRGREKGKKCIVRMWKREGREGRWRRKGGTNKEREGE
jgi:hypothetical protein